MRRTYIGISFAASYFVKIKDYYFLDLAASIHVERGMKKRKVHAAWLNAQYKKEFLLPDGALIKADEALARAFLKRFSSLGGLARAKILSPEQRLHIARMGGEATRKYHLSKKQKASK